MYQRESKESFGNGLQFCVLVVRVEGIYSLKKMVIPSISLYKAQRMLIVTP